MLIYSKIVGQIARLIDSSDFWSDRLRNRRQCPCRWRRVRVARVGHKSRRCKRTQNCFGCHTPADDNPIANCYCEQLNMAKKLVLIGYLVKYTSIRSGTQILPTDCQRNSRQHKKRSKQRDDWPHCVGQSEFFNLVMEVEKLREFLTKLIIYFTIRVK